MLSLRLLGLRRRGPRLDDLAGLVQELHARIAARVHGDPDARPAVRVGERDRGALVAALPDRDALEAVLAARAHLRARGVLLGPRQSLERLVLGDAIGQRAVGPIPGHESRE